MRPAEARPADDTQEDTAAGVYGIIVSAGVMAGSHAPTVAATVLTVLVTLAVYWAAERYARILAERLHQGHRPRWETVRAQLTSGWQMITASFLPLAELTAAWLLGAEQRTAIVVALIGSTVQLSWSGWRIGRHGRLNPAERIVSAGVAGLFGAALIVLKTVLH